MENQTKVIAERLKMARHNAELTVVDMAEAAGVSASEYERLETVNTIFRLHSFSNALQSSEWIFPNL